MQRLCCSSTLYVSVVCFTEKAPMKTAYVDVSSCGRTDRVEWGNARYHAHYHPGAAFELELQWLVATGSILGELVSVHCNDIHVC